MKKIARKYVDFVRQPDVARLLVVALLSRMPIGMVGFSMLMFVYICFVTFTSKQKVADNYWGEGATTLEWTLTSPPAFHTFEELPRLK